MTAPAGTIALRATEGSRVSLWEDTFEGSATETAFAALRRLADCLRQDDPLAALAIRDKESAHRLGRYLFDRRSEVSRMAMVSLDADAHSVVRDASAMWRRLVQLPIRELPTAEWPCRMTEDTLVMAVSAATHIRCMNGEDQKPEAKGRVAWVGSEPPSWLNGIGTPAGHFVLPASGPDCLPVQLYAALHLLIAEAWSHYEPEKAGVVRRHISGAADAVIAALNNGRLLEEIREVADANVRYRTAFFISPFTASGRFWEKQFDRSGGPMVVHHLPGNAGHGPIVTIDGDAEEKYISLTHRADMVACYGEGNVAKWEGVFLNSVSVDRFLAQVPDLSARRPKAPFFTDSHWHLPVLNPDYDTRKDNLILLDMTSERDLPVMLDELSLLGSRLPRLVILTQKERIREVGEKSLFSFPVSNLVVLPEIDGHPIADLHLPLVLMGVGAALAGAWNR
jgi:hypothetical protein